MKTLLRPVPALSIAASALLFSGCGKEPASAPPAAETETVTEEVVEEVEVPAVDPAGAATATAEVTAAFASLSEPDRTAALAQKICPVSDEPLGTMGTPLKVTVEGRDVFLCCEGCKKALEEDPQKFLAKLK